MQMKKPALFIMPLVFSILVPTSTVFAQDISTEKAENIKVNCSDIKNAVKRVQNSDRNTRVSLGRTYQQILSDFITPLNVRLVKNNRFDYNLNDIQNRFVTAREQFNKDYIYYSQTLETLLAADCNGNPSDFYNKLVETRRARATVAKSTTKLESIIDEHINSVKGLADSFRPKEKTDE